METNLQMVGAITEVLVEEVMEDGSYCGRTWRDAPEIDDSILFTADRPLKIGDLVKVRVTDAFDYDLTGVLQEEVKHESSQ